MTAAIRRHNGGRDGACLEWGNIEERQRHEGKEPGRDI